MWDGIDRRKFPRVQYPCLITVYKRTSPSFSILTHTENVSIGGVRVIISKKIEIATEVDLEIDLQDTNPNIISRGTVAWVKKLALGQQKEPAPKEQTSKILKGTVAWVREIPSTQEGKPSCYDTGVQFIGLKKDDRERVQHIIAHFASYQNRKG